MICIVESAIESLQNKNTIILYNNNNNNTTLLHTNSTYS